MFTTNVIQFKYFIVVVNEIAGFCLLKYHLNTAKIFERRHVGFVVLILSLLGSICIDIEANIESVFPNV